MNYPPDTQQARLRDGVWVIEFRSANVTREVVRFNYRQGPGGSTVTARIGNDVLVPLTRGDTQGYEPFIPVPLPAGQTLTLTWSSGAGIAGPIGTLYTRRP
jgi:hypothetical protein